MALASEEKNLLEAQVLPNLKRNGIKGTVAVIDAPVNDVVAGTQQATTIAERFKADGIKTVLLVGGTPSAFTNGLKNSDFRPKLVGTNFSTFQGAAINKATDPRVLQGRGHGRHRYRLQRPESAEVLQDGREGDRRHHPRTPGDRQARLPGLGAQCLPVRLLVRQLATAAGKDLTVAGFGKAAAKLGSVTIPGLGVVKYDPKTHTWLQPMYTYKYDTARQQLVIDQKVG